LSVASLIVPAWPIANEVEVSMVRRKENKLPICA
jgi:hypothetical protein